MREADQPGRRTRSAIVTVSILIALCLLLAFAWRQGREVEGRHALGGAGATKARDAHFVDSTPSATAPTLGKADSTRLLSDPATPEDPQALRCTTDRRLQLRQRLAQLGPPDSPQLAIQSALLAMMSSPQPGIEISRALQAARKRWPDSLDLAWLHLMYCSEPSACNKEQALVQLSRLDPDNAATWLYAMLFARQRNDATAYSDALNRAAKSGFYDPRSGMVFLHIRPVLAELAPPQSCVAPEAAADLHATLGRPAETADWADIA